MANDSGKVFREVFETIIIALVLAFLVRSFVVESFLVDGRSMEPTLYNNERLFVNKFGYRISPPKRGDIIVFQYPKDTSRDFIKRVIALPGEEIEIKDQSVYIDGVLLEEPYVDKGDYEPHPKEEIPEGKLFVLGDNYGSSEDSRFFGPVPLKNVKGKALVVYWPVADLRILQH